MAEMAAAMYHAEVLGVVHKGGGTAMSVAAKQRLIVALTDEMSFQKQRSFVYSALVLVKRFDRLG